MSEYNNESLSAKMFDKACELINRAIRNGNHPLVCVTAVENMLRKNSLLDEGFIQVLVNDLSDFYFWHPECSGEIDKKWHTLGVDLYKSYLPVKSKVTEENESKGIDRKSCFVEIERNTPSRTLLTMSMEECAELQQAISKILRYGKCEDKYFKQLSEEMADTLICIRHLLNLFDNEKEVDNIMDYKLYRTVQKLRNEQNKGEEK